MTKALSALLANGIDYAGLFPPAKLEMQEAVRTYKWLRQDENASWLVGRFVCPAGLLAEMEAEAGDDECEVCVTGQSVGDISKVGNLRKSRPVAFEAKLPLEHIEIAKEELDPISLFAEVPLDLIDTTVAEIARVGALAKIRTGGTEAGAFPAAADVARFITACNRHGVAFKATGGLHHPLYHHDKEYGVMMHGFLNVFLGAALAMKGGDIGSITQVLELQDKKAVVFDEGGVRVLDYLFTNDDLFATRRFALSFGSCSVDEPLEDLIAMGFLEAVAL